MIKVLQVFARLDCGGAETMLINLYRHMNRKNVQFDFVVHTNDVCFYDEVVKKYGGKIFHCPKYTGRNHREYVQWWKMFLSEHQEYSIVHSHVRSTASIYLSIAKKKGFITIAHSHSTSNGMGVEAIVKYILQLPLRYIADYLFACSKEAGVWLYGKKSINYKNFFVVKNAIDIERFHYNEQLRQKFRKQLSLSGRLVIGTVGRIEAVKNHLFLIDIVKEICKRNPEFILMLIGNGSLLKDIRKKVRALHLDNNVLFIGEKNNVEDYMQVMDVFVVPSKYEGLGIVVIEAQAMGLPCVISDVIPKEVNILDSIERVSLKSRAADWAGIIIKASNYDRELNSEKLVKKSGYDIKDTAKWMEKFYYKIAKRK